MNSGAMVGTNIAHDVVSSMSQTNARLSVADASRVPGAAGDSTSMYFERPVLITSGEWTPAPFTGLTSPLTVILAKDTVRRKLQNFTLIKFDIEIEIDVVGNPFNYGQMIAAWVPYTRYDDITKINPLGIGSIELALMTQRQHVLLDVSVSTTKTLVIPFYWPYEYFNMLTDDPDQFGFLEYGVMNELRHVSGGDPLVSFMIRARLVNCEVCVNTYQAIGSLPGMEVQAKFKKHGRYHKGNEKPEGAISSAASRMADFAHAVAPILGPGAIATESAMDVAAAAFAAIGLSHPRSNEDSTRIANNPFGNMSNHNAVQDAYTLALDAENEVTYSAAAAGLMEDEMSFDTIMKKETFIGTIEWDQTVPIGSTLAWIPVEPMKVVSDSFLTDRNVAIPMAYVGQMFSYWTGSISFRFQFIASQFHRGRVRIYHEPRFWDGTSAERWTANQLAVIDITEEKDFTIEVDWCQANAWALNRRLQEKINPIYFTPPAQSDLIECNGVIAIDVVNRMTIPDPAVVAPVTINIFAKAGPDFRYAALRDDFSTIHFEPPPPPVPTPVGQPLGPSLVGGLLRNTTPTSAGAATSGEFRVPIWATDTTTAIGLSILGTTPGSVDVVGPGDVVYASPTLNTISPVDVVLSLPTSLGYNSVPLNVKNGSTEVPVVVAGAILPPKPGYKYVSNVNSSGDFRTDFSNDLSTPGGDYPYQQNLGAAGAPQLRWVIGGTTNLYKWRNVSYPVFVTYKGSMRTTNGIYGPTEDSATSATWTVAETTPDQSWSSNNYQIMSNGAPCSIKQVIFLDVQADFSVQADFVSPGEETVPDSDPGTLTVMQKETIPKVMPYIYFGEQYAHMRQLLGRWVQLQRWIIQPAAFPPFRRFYSYQSVPAYPYRPAVMTGLPPAQLAFSAHTWISAPYNGMRGTYRIRYHVESNAPVAIISTLLPPANFFVFQQENLNDDAVTVDDILNRSFNGTRWQQASLNPTTIVEIPYFTRKKFLPSAGRSTAPTAATSVGALSGFRTTETNVVLSRFAQAGDDFTLVNWVSTPILYFY